MIYGIGVDLIHEGRIRRLPTTPADPFFQKTYTEAERTQALDAADPAYYYAERFAAKEAVFKALQLSPEGVRLNEIETLNAETGAPRVILHGRLEQCRQDAGTREVHLSLSYDPPYAIAFAVCEI